MSTVAPLRFGGRADAALEWACATGCRDLALDPGEPARVGLLVRWRWAGRGPHPLARPHPPVQVADVYRHTRHAVLTVPRDWLLDPRASDILLDQAESLALAAPVSFGQSPPTSVAAGQAFAGVRQRRGLAHAQGEVLLGLIDAQLPLALPWLYPQGAGRVLRFWNQDDHAAGQSPAAGFGYGKELVAGDPEAGLPGPDDIRNDQACHAQLGRTDLRRRTSHGAAVLDVLAGPLPVRSRVPASRDSLHGGDGTATLPPSRHVATDVAATAPLVLVQFPQRAVDDASGAWLNRHALDGLHYILEAAGSPHRFERVVVNLSWGPQTGPRDGTQLLETAIDELVERETRQGRRRLEVVLPAGNTWSARAHAQFDARTGHAGLVWCVPPDLRRPGALELWWPAQAPTCPALTVRAPDGSIVRCTGPGLHLTSGSAWGVVLQTAGTRWMARLAVGPTFRQGPGLRAPHGRWTVQVGSIACEGLVHVSVARTDANVGGRHRGHVSWLWDPLDQRWRQTGGEHRRQPAPAGAAVSGDATLQGLSTGSRTRVAGGWRLSDGQPAPYTASGAATARGGPDLALPTEESVALSGLRAGAVRPGSTVRFAGTSLAAPQHARQLASGGPPEAVQPAQDPRLGWRRD